jgi:cytidylate kinase
MDRENPEDLVDRLITYFQLSQLSQEDKKGEREDKYDKVRKEIIDRIKRRDSLDRQQAVALLRDYINMLGTLTTQEKINEFNMLEEQIIGYMVN